MNKIPLTVLFVDDEIEIHKLMQKTIKEYYKDCLIAVDGQDGLNKFLDKNNRIDLIVTDVTMPNMDGLTMCEKIRRVDKNVPIIILTAHNDNSHLYKAIDIGVTGYVLKPTDVVKLFETMKKAVEPILLHQEIEEQKIEHQKALLEEARYSALGQLSAGIVHEINTPLTYMKLGFELIGYDVEELEDLKIKESIQSELKTINGGFKRLENIINSMKEIAGSNKKELATENIYNTILVSLNMAYNKSKHIVPISINGDSFEIGMDDNRYIFNAVVEASRIEQVWIIIINNALDELVHIKEYEKRVLAIEVSKDDNDVVIKFKDNAGGINDKILEYIFEPFKSLKKSNGMGLGLNIAKKIIQDHNGEIKAYNENDGAVFEIKLPMA